MITPLKLTSNYATYLEIRDNRHLDCKCEDIFYNFSYFYPSSYALYDRPNVGMCLVSFRWGGGHFDLLTC